MTETLTAYFAEPELDH